MEINYIRALVLKQQKQLKTLSIPIYRNFHRIDVFKRFNKGNIPVIGNIGFKGSWLSIWLHELGAEVHGVGLEPYSEKVNFVFSVIGRKIKADICAYIREGEKMKEIIRQYQPEIVFHLEAQSQILLSYKISVENYLVVY